MSEKNHHAEGAKVMLAHGSGGKMMHRLIEEMFIPAFANPQLENRHDGAVFDAGKTRLAFTTDSYVVHPIFFPGGDIGDLAVNGTINDLAMCGARPIALSASFIIEEGFPMDDLRRVVRSMRKAADAAGVSIVTGDTKVVDKGKGDGLFVNTAGVGIVGEGISIAPGNVREGDLVMINGDIGRHGIAVMAVREGLSFETAIESDTAPLNDIVMKLLAAGVRIHCMRDLTRGGLATTLVEIAESSRRVIRIDEGAIPVRDDVQGACEILGFDPLYVANEGRFAAFVDPSDGERALAIMRAHPLGAGASIVGAVAGADEHGMVNMKSKIGAMRIVDMLSGEQLPRIC